MSRKNKDNVYAVRVFLDKMEKSINVNKAKTIKEAPRWGRKISKESLAQAENTLLQAICKVRNNIEKGENYE